jgi:aspartate kinase
MKVYKFGGASVKNAAAIKNVERVLKNNTDTQLLVVISAMGKTTNKLEELTRACFENHDTKRAIFEDLKNFHYEIINELIKDEFDFYEVDNLFIELECLIEKSRQSDWNYDQLYDQIVPYGELISTKIVGVYLNKNGYKNRFIDARNFILTDEKYRNGTVNWSVTEELISQSLKPLLKRQTIITQGFIGRSSNLNTVTLGREGSDYSAAIFAYCLDAKSVTIWKDVEGVMNADPKLFPDAILIPELSYNEAIELAYYGASVIHPKTIQPLKSKKIPLFVKSFTNDTLQGTKIFEHSEGKLNQTKCFIVKKNQYLIKISSKDFSFIVEDHLNYIFKMFSEIGIQVNLMQNTAISFTACFQANPSVIEKIENTLIEQFNVEMTEGYTLFTVFNCEGKTPEVIAHTKSYESVLEQLTFKTLQLVLK